MVNRYIAYTKLVNPKGTMPVLTKAQLWAGLQVKVRNAPQFVQAITSCKVLNIEGNIVTREVVFNDGFGNPNVPVKEVCEEHAPTMVNFKQPDGSLIQNVISDGPGGNDEDLHLTYVFEILRPGVDAGSAEDKKVVELYEKMSKIAVDGTIATVRRLVIAGEL